MIDLYTVDRRAWLARLEAEDRQAPLWAFIWVVGAAWGLGFACGAFAALWRCGLL